MSSERRLGWLAVLAGAAFALAVQVAAPTGVPLYDGVVPIEPYRYLDPIGDQLGDPTSFTSTVEVSDGESPQFVAATTESTPQAQLIATEDAFEVPAGTTELHTSIAPIDPPPGPADGSIAGNVYRISVTDQAGTPLVPKPCEGCRTLVLRAPEDVVEGSIERYAEGSWTQVATYHAGTVAIYQANPDALGDFAVVVGGAGSGLDPLVFGGIALAIFGAVVAGLFWYRRRPPPIPVARLGPTRGRIPSKRRGPRRPPGGRS